MFMHCLHCAEIIHHQMVIPLVVVKKSYFSWPDIQEENDKFFIRCPNCNRRNFFIKEYSGYSNVTLRLSHVEE